MDFVFTADASQLVQTFNSIRKEVLNIVDLAKAGGDSIDSVVRRLSGENVSLSAPVEQAVKSLMTLSEGLSKSTNGVVDLKTQITAAFDVLEKSTLSERQKFGEFMDSIEGIVSSSANRISSSIGNAVDKANYNLQWYRNEYMKVMDELAGSDMIDVDQMKGKAASVMEALSQKANPEETKVTVRDDTTNEFVTQIEKIDEATRHARESALNGIRDITEGVNSLIGNISSGSSEEVQKAIDNIQPLYQKLQQMFEEQEKTLRESPVDSAEYTEAANKAFVYYKALEQIRDVQTQLSDGMVYLEKGDALREQASQLEDLITKESELLKGLEESKKSIEDLKAESTSIPYQEYGQKSADILSEKANESVSNLDDGEIAKVEEAIKNVRGLRESFDELGEALVNYKNEATETAREVEDAYNKQSEVVNTLEARLKELEEAQADPAKSADEVDRLKREYNLLSDELEEAKKKQEELSQTLEDTNEKIDNAASAINKYNTVASIRDGFDGFTEKVKGATSAVKDWATGNGKFQEGLNAFKDNLNKLPLPLGDATDGIMGMVSSMRVMMATPLGRVLALITAALSALTTWFNKSTEGQMAFAKISGYVGSIVQSLTDVFMKFGKYVYNAFATSNGAMNGFAKGIVKTLGSAIKTAVNLIQGLGKTLKGVGQMFSGDFEAGWESMKEGVSQVWKGLGNGLETIKNAWDASVEGVKGVLKMTGDGIDKLSSTNIEGSLLSMHETAKKEAVLAEQRKKTEQDIGKAVEERALAEGKIVEHKERIAVLSGKEKLAEILQLKKEEAKKYEDEIAARERLLAIAKEQDGLHINSLKDEEALRKLNVELLRVKKEQNAAVLAATKLESATRRQMEREGKSAGKKAESEAKRAQRLSDAEAAAEAKYAELLYQQELERIKQEEDMEKRISDASIASMKDGAEKKIAERKRQNEKELEELEKQQQAAIEKERERQKKAYEAEQAILKAGGKQRSYDFVFDENSDAVQRIKAYYETLESFTRMKQETQAKKDAEALINSHQSYTDKKIQIDKDYAETVKEIDAAIDKAEKNGEKDLVEALKRTRKKALEDRAKELSAIEMQILKESPEYVMAFENLSRASSETLKDLIQKFEDAKQHAAETMAPDQFREFMTTLDKMYDEVNNRNPFDVLANSVEKLKTAQDSLKIAQGIYDDVKAGKTVINPVTGKAYTEEEARRNLVNAMEAESRAYDNVIKKVVACGDKLKAFGGTLSQLGQMIGGDIGKGLGAAGGIFDSVGGVMSSIKNYDRNAKGISKVMQNVSLVTTAASAMIDMNKQLDSILPDQQSLYEHYAKKQAEINRQRRTIMELEIAQLEERLNNETWFYSNSLSQLRKNGELNKEYLKAYGDIAAAPQEVYKEASSGFSKWGPAIIGAIVGIVVGAVTFGSGTIAGAALATALSSATAAVGISALSATIVTAIGAVLAAGVNAAVANIIRSGWDSITYENGQTAALNNMRVQTRHSTFFRSEKTQDLDSWVRENWGQELYDKELTEKYGAPMVDTEVVRRLLSEEGPTLVGETRETLEMLLEYKEKIDDFLQEIKDYVSKAFSPLVDDLSNALWDWLKDGKDVMESFREYAADTFKSIAQDALKIMANKIIFDPFKEQLEDLVTAYSVGAEGYDEAGYIAAVSALAGEMQEKIQQNLPALENTAKVMQLAFEGVGIDIVGTSEKAAGSVDDLRSTFVLALKDMGKSADDFRKTLQESLFDELVNDIVLNEDFDKWFNEWKTAYREAVESGDVERMTALLEENVQKREELSEKTKQIAESIGMSDVEKEISNSLNNLADTFMDNLLDMDADAEEMGKQIASTLIKEMLQTLLASEKYAGRIKEIKEKWQQILNGEETAFTMEDVLRDIADLNNDIANDESISALANQYKELNKTVEKTNTVFSNLRTTFLNTLTDMKGDAESFRKTLEDTMLRDLIEKKVLDVPITVNGMAFDDFNAYVENWNERYATEVKNGNREAIESLLDELVEVRAMTLAQVEVLRTQLEELNEVSDETFKGMTGSFISALMDTNKTAEDWAQDIGQTMAQKIIEQMVSAKMIQPLLDELQLAFNAAMGAENATYESVLSDVDVSNALGAIKNAFPGLQSVAQGIMESLGLKKIGNGFSNLRDTFINTLVGMDEDAQNLGKNIAVSMMEQMLDTLVDKRYSERMKQVNEEWALALEEGDPTKIEAIRQKVVSLYETIGNDGAVKRLADDIKALTSTESTPFDNFRSSYLSALTDMNKSTEDFTKEISEMIAQSFIDSFVLGDMFDERIEEWKKRYKDITSDTGLSEEERLKQLRGLSELIAAERESMQGEVSNIYDMLGINDREYQDQQATVNMADKATYDQFETYLGIAVAQQIATEQGNAVRLQILSTLQTMSGITSPNGDTVKEIRSMLRTTNEHLYAIKSATEGIRQEFMPRLQSIDNKLSRL